MKMRITALLITTASVPALTAFPVSQPAQASEVMLRMCQHQCAGIEKNKTMSKVYGTVGGWPIASTTEATAAVDKDWIFAVKNTEVKYD